MPFLQTSALNPSSDEAESMPLYHPGMLLVKIKSGTPLGDFAPAGMGPAVLTRAAVSALPGLGTLLSYERSGLIRRIVSLAEPAAGVVTGDTPLLSAVATSVRASAAADPNASTSLVELHNDNDLPALESRLREDPTIEDFSRVPVRYLEAKKKAARKKKAAPATPAATPPGSMIWNLNKIRWAAARARTGFKDATNINVAVLDTGIDEQHPDLAGVVASYSFDHPTTPSASSRRDLHGHGTHVAGTIAARINNAVGINGLCTCRIHAMKIFDDKPDYSPWDGIFTYFVEPVMYRRALSRCVTLGVQVINLSIGGGGRPDFLEQRLFDSLIQRGVSIVAAMGNENSDAPSYPAAIDNVIAVGATSIDDTRAWFSNRGPHIAVCAPGVSIWSTLPTYAGNQGFRAKPTFPPTPDLARPLSRDRNYAAWDGTSMACPHVAGAAALVLAKLGSQTGAQVKARLQSRAVRVAGMNGQSFTKEYGSGRLDLYKLLS